MNFYLSTKLSFSVVTRDSTEISESPKFRKTYQSVSVGSEQDIFVKPTEISRNEFQVSVETLVVTNLSAAWLAELTTAKEIASALSPTLSAPYTETWKQWDCQCP